MDFHDQSLRAVCGSESRYRVFRALYRAPNADFHLRGLAQAASVDPAQVARLLPRLVAAGLCERIEARPNARYRASARHPLHAALSSLFADGGAPAASRGDSPMKRIEERSLALHEAAIDRMTADPSLLDRARSTLRSWIARYAERPPGALLEWKEILSQPLDEVSAVALERSPHGDRLRKSSPLSVLVPRGERRKIYAAH